MQGAFRFSSETCLGSFGCLPLDGSPLVKPFSMSAFCQPIAKTATYARGIWPTYAVLPHAESPVGP
jgi:hypothetical protein